MSDGILDCLFGDMSGIGMFENCELCDGGQCASKQQCARYIANVDISKARNLYTVFNRTARVCCLHFLERPDENYPNNGNSYGGAADSPQNLKEKPM